MDKLAVVILNFNGSHYLEKFLPLVLSRSSGYPVYVADNFSTDNSLTLLRKKFPGVQIIEFSRNYGYSDGYNRALQKISAQYYMLLNSDVEVTEAWLDPLVDLLDRDPLIAACQPKLVQYHNRSLFEYAGAAGGFIDQYGYPFCRGRIFHTIEHDYGQYDDTRPVFWASGACMLIRSSVFHESGGFDPDYFAHMEEIDLCWRIQRSGYRIFYCGDSVVYHVGGGTLPSSDPLKTYLNFRNSLITLIKNSGKKGFYRKLALRALMDIAASFKFLFSGATGSFQAVVRANYHVYRRIRIHMQKRRSQHPGSTTSANIYPHSLAFDYYLRGKKFFFNIDSVIPDPVVTAT